MYMEYMKNLTTDVCRWPVGIFLFEEGLSFLISGFIPAKSRVLSKVDAMKIGKNHRVNSIASHRVSRQANRKK